MEGSVRLQSDCCPDCLGSLSGFSRIAVRNRSETLSALPGMRTGRALDQSAGGGAARHDPQMDETTVQVLKEDGRPAQSESRMWVRRGGPPNKLVILLDYDPSRSARLRGA